MSPLERSLSQFLREETAALHQDIEKKSPLLKDHFTLADYRLLLKKTLSYFRAYEHWAKSSPFFLRVPQAEIRKSRSQLLEKDLKALGEEPLNLPVEKFSEPNSDAAALGCMYVIEGSTLGGQFITKHLIQKLSLGSDQVSFYEGYGFQTFPLWQQFKEFVDAQNLAVQERLECLQQAKKVFEDFGALFSFFKSY